MIEDQAVIECLTNTAKYYELEDADEWTKGIHYGLLHALDNILDNVPTVEAIPKAEVKKFLEEGAKNISNNVLAIVREDYIHKADYENRLKTDMAAMLTELKTEIDIMSDTDVKNRIITITSWKGMQKRICNLIQQKIDELKGEEDGKNKKTKSSDEP